MFVTDTHALIWFFNGKHSSLSPKVLKAFEKAEKGEVVIYISVGCFLGNRSARKTRSDKSQGRI